jgi:ATP-dependent exoDNAse (exonuclease V) beta subunit
LTKSGCRSTNVSLMPRTEAELEDISEAERRLLYVACTRAREHLLLTGLHRLLNIWPISKQKQAEQTRKFR